MSDPPDHFDLVTEVRDLFEAKLREFASFCAKNWKTTAEESEMLRIPSSAPAEYARGYNDAMTEGLEGELEHWLDETGYGR